VVCSENEYIMTSTSVTFFNALLLREADKRTEANGVGSNGRSGVFPPNAGQTIPMTRLFFDPFRAFFRAFSPKHKHGGRLAKRRDLTCKDSHC